MDRTEKACASKEAYKPDSVTPARAGGMSQNSLNLLWEACGRLPETFDPSYGLGAVFRRLDEMRARSTLPVTQSQKLGYAYNWYI